MDLKETDILGSKASAHWYYISKARALNTLLSGISPKKILDIGAGSGFFSRHLLATTDATEACCVDISYEEDCSDQENAKLLRFCRAVETSDADIVLLMDVLEHVDNDVELLRRYVDLSPAGTRFIITVPAFNWLWSQHDVFLEHRRRYTLAGLEAVVREAGLVVENSCYYFCAVFPIAAALRLFDKFRSQHHAPQSTLRMHTPFVNGLLKLFCNIERPIMLLNRLAGLSACCRARKRR